MDKIVIQGSLARCSFAAGPPVPLAAAPGPAKAQTQPELTIMDSKPFVNVPSFGMCTAPTNPAVIAAWGAPVPCTPVIPAPWTPGSQTKKINSLPALTASSMCNCAYAGVITITQPVDQVSSAL